MLQLVVMQLILIEADMKHLIEKLIDAVSMKKRNRSRAKAIQSILTTKTEDGSVWGPVGQILSDLIGEAISTSDGKPIKAETKKESNPNHQVAAEILKHIADNYEMSFQNRFECNYGWDVPSIRRLLDKGEEPEELKRLAEAWLSAGKGELVPGDNYQNRRIWGDAKIKTFTNNLNLIKTVAPPKPKPKRQWVNPSEVQS